MWYIQNGGEATDRPWGTNKIYCNCRPSVKCKEWHGVEYTMFHTITNEWMTELRIHVKHL